MQAACLCLPLAAAEAFENAGATPEPVKAHAAQLRSDAEAVCGELATGADLAELKAEPKADSHSLIWRMIGFVVVPNAVITAVLGGLLVAVLDRVS